MGNERIEPIAEGVSTGGGVRAGRRAGVLSSGSVPASTQVCLYAGTRFFCPVENEPKSEVVPAVSLTTLDEIGRRVRPETFLHATQPKTTKPSNLLAAAHLALKLAERIEIHWSELSEEEKQNWRAFAHYSVVGPRHGLRVVLSNFITGIRLASTVFVAVVTGQSDTVLAYFGAVLRLKGAVLQAVEREHPEYEKTLVEAATNAIGEVSTRKPVTPEEFREWLDTISGDSIRKVSA